MITLVKPKSLMTTDQANIVRLNKCAGISPRSNAAHGKMGHQPPAYPHASPDTLSLPHQGGITDHEEARQ